MAAAPGAVKVLFTLILRKDVVNPAPMVLGVYGMINRKFTGNLVMLRPQAAFKEDLPPSIPWTSGVGRLLFLLLQCQAWSSECLAFLPVWGVEALAERKIMLLPSWLRELL